MKKNLIKNAKWQCTSTAEFGTGNNVDIWKFFAVDLMDKQYLSNTELLKLSRIKNEKTRKLFVASRTIMRKLFTQYLQVPIQALHIDIQAAGKPYLRDYSRQLQFNLSHTGELVLLAISNGFPVGIDIEKHRHVANKEQIAKKVFPEFLMRQFSASNNNASENETFINLWTELEARQKLMGESIFNTEKDSSAVNIFQFEAEDNYASTLAYSAEIADVAIRFYEYSG